MDKFILLVFVVGLCSGVQSQQTQRGSDPIAPLITFLQQLQRLRELYNSGGASANLNSLNTPLTSNLPRQDNVPLADNSIDGETPNTNSNTNSNRPSLFSFFNRNSNSNNSTQQRTLTDFIQGLRAANFLDRIFRRGESSNGSSFTQNLISNIFNRNSNSAVSST